MLVDGRNVAAVCSERCGYELIGPKRGADDSAAADDAAHQQMLVRRQQDKQRFSDLAELSTSLGSLSKLRIRIADMTPLEVSTATLAIGRRLAADGSGMEKRIEAVIFDVHTTIGRIIRGEPYEMPNIRVQLQRLRGDIAADASLDAFDAATGYELKLANMPDDARQLVAYRANPVQKLAEFSTYRMGVGDSFFVINGSDNIVVDDLIFRPFGEEMDDRHNESTFRAQLTEEKYNFRIKYDRSPIWRVDSFQEDTYQTIVSIQTDDASKKASFPVDRDSVFVATEQHAAIFSLDAASGHISYRRFNSIKRVFENTAILPVDVPHFSVYAFTIDMNGYVWCVDSNDHLFVFSPSGISIAVDATNRPVPVITDRPIQGVAASADGSVWTLSVQRRLTTCIKYRLVPDDEYMRGL